MLKVFDYTQRKDPKTRASLNVLFIDDEVDQAEALALCQDQWVISSLSSPQPLFDGQVDVSVFDLVIVDLVFNAVELTQNKFEPSTPHLGCKVLHWFRENSPQKPVVAMSALLANADEVKQFQIRFPEVVCFGKPMDFSDSNFGRILERLGRGKDRTATA